MKILLSLSSRTLKNGKRNPKNYPYSGELIELLHKQNHHTVQVRTDENEILPAMEVISNATFEELAEIIKGCDCFIAIDNFIQHYASYLGKRGIVVFSLSNPTIFGYPQNINLLKNKKYLRKNQFDTWEADEFMEKAFVSPQIIVKKIQMLA